MSDTKKEDARPILPTDRLYTSCPHCGGGVEVIRSEINCKIHRHLVMKDTGKQGNPHASQVVCEALVKANKVYGCGKPFWYDGLSPASVCEWI